MKFHFPARALILTAALTATMAVSAYAYDVQGGTVTTSSAVNFRQEATTQSESMGKLSDGTRVAILDEIDGWYKVAYNGEVGYMSADYVESQPIMNIECGGAKVTTSVLNMRSGPGTENSIVTKLYEGSVAKIIGINNAWFKVQYGGKTGYISPDYVSIVPYKATATASAPVAVSTSSGSASTASGTRQQIIDYAAKFLGCKYVYGGNTPSGFDCSGFTLYLFKQHDISLPHGATAQYKNCGEHVAKENLQPGDLVFFSDSSHAIGHCAVYVGDDTIIHARNSVKSVVTNKLSSSYYTSHYVGAKRIG